MREGWSTRQHVEKGVKANNEDWEMNLNVSAQDKSNLTTITDEKESCLSPKLTGWCMRQRVTEMRTRTTSRRSRPRDLLMIVRLRTLQEHGSDGLERVRPRSEASVVREIPTS